MPSRSRGNERINVSELPRAIVDLLEHLHKRAPGPKPYPLRQLPHALQRRDVLRTAMDRWLVRVLVWSGSASTRPSTGSSVNCWARFNAVGFADTLDAGLAKNQSIDTVSDQLHVELTLPADAAITEHLLHVDEAPPPKDVMTLAVASKRYHITPKGLREAIHSADRPLRDYRSPTAASNAPMLVSEADVARRWLKRDVVLA